MKNKLDISDFNDQIANFKNELLGLREMIGNIEADERKPLEVKASLPTSQA